MAKTAFWVWCLFVFGTGVQAQETSRFFRTYTEKDGLSDRRVQCIWRDREGWLWVGTAFGLNRFDGRTFTTYLPDPDHPGRSVSHESIFAIAEDSRQRLWIATANGLNCFDPKTQTFRIWKNTGRDNGSLPNSWVNHLWVDSLDRVWLACDNRDLTCFDPPTGKFTAYPWKSYAAQALPSTANKEYRTIERIEPKSAHEIWLFANIGLFSFDLRRLEFAHHRSREIPSPRLGVALPEGADAAISFPDAHGAWWLGGAKGLWRYEGYAARIRQLEGIRPGKVAPEESSSPAFHMLDLRKLPLRLILDVHANRLIFVENQEVIKTVSIPGRRAVMVYEDRKGMIWVGGERQLFQVDPATGRLSPFPVPDSLWFGRQPSTFRTMAEDSRGRYWFGNDQEGVFIYDPATRLWSKPVESQGFISLAPWHMLADPTQKRLWIGTEDYGLFLYDETKDRFVHYEHDETDPRHSLGAFIIPDLCLDPNGRLWAATDPGGISGFAGGPGNSAFDTYGLREGLPSSRILGITADPAGRLWLATSRGLICRDPASRRFQLFDSEEGLPQEPPQGQIRTGRGGEILFSTERGVYAFHPDSVLIQPGDSRILLSDFRVAGLSRVNPLRPLRNPGLKLSWKDNFLILNFPQLTFSHLEKLNMPTSWLDSTPHGSWQAGRVEGLYQRAPGKYRLLIRSGRNGQWNQPGYRLNLVIAPPFWQTWWFLLLLLAGAGSIGWGMYRWRVAQIRKEERMKAGFQRRIAEVEMSALRAQMNPHFIFNCLNSINRFILVNEPDAASDYLTKFSRLIRLILDHSRTERISLDRELDALRLYIELEAMRFDHKFAYEIDVAPEVVPGQIDIPPLLLQPYVENAIWHGLMQKKTNGRLWVRVFRIGPDLGIEIQDDGVGRKAAAELKSKSASRQKSHGTAVTAERLELIRRLFGVDAQIDITDLYDSGGAPAGTRVMIRIQTNAHDERPSS
ncbi:MAG: histidine kinase [Haliscomenobacter sp.]|nr:histidine kinase [Haliscomenobacter sp.]